MLISRALAAHGVVGTGGSGGDALLIILGIVIALGVGYWGLKKWRRRSLEPDDDDESPDQ